VADEFTERLNRGEQPDVEEYARRHPQIATLLREALPALEAMGPLASDPGLAGAPPAPAEQLTGCLGDFRILREVGRGGMGVVYEAEQLSLGRRVALKVLPFAAALDARQRQRFQNEAQAAAHLQHTNIVPVYYVGCERGVHFYAMQFIDGQTVAALIRELRHLAGLEGPDAGPGPAPAPPPPSSTQATAPAEPTAPVAALSTEGSTRSPTFFRTAARLGLQAALALEHAHAEGVVHRDVKPANLLVNGRGTLWVTDFGLARFRGEAGLTLSGDLVGTLRYMSPEQALGQRHLVDHRTDIYSLGATLYELLTLEPVHDGRDRQELLRQIASEPPRPPRRLNPAVPADLETVVLKALDKEPEARYATAQELADDLRRFLEDKPIRARRPTLWQRARKWARRHRPVVVSAAVLLALAVLALAVGSVLLTAAYRAEAEQRRRAEAQERLARQALDRAEAEQRRRAEAQEELARQILDVYTEVVEKLTDHHPHLQEVQVRFLLQASRYYERLAQESGTDPALRHKAGIALHRVGELQCRLGQLTSAKETYDQAIALQTELVAQFPAAPQHRQGLAASLENLSILLMGLYRPAEAEQARRRVLPLREQLVADFPTKLHYRWDLGRVPGRDPIPTVPGAKPLLLGQHPEANRPASGGGTGLWPGGGPLRGAPSGHAPLCGRAGQELPEPGLSAVGHRSPGQGGPALPPGPGPMGKAGGRQPRRTAFRPGSGLGPGRLPGPPPPRGEPRGRVGPASRRPYPPGLAVLVHPGARAVPCGGVPGGPRGPAPVHGTRGRRQQLELVLPGHGPREVGRGGPGPAVVRPGLRRDGGGQARQDMAPPPPRGSRRRVGAAAPGGRAGREGPPGGRLSPAPAGHTPPPHGPG
jgi:serine/threonine protein kinase